jgi:hypothetical protein
MGLNAWREESRSSQSPTWRLMAWTRPISRNQAILSPPGKALEFEARLLDTEDAVDQLIAQYASVHLADEPSEDDGWMSAAAPWLNPG